jgi:hypothetical protein
VKTGIIMAEHHKHKDDSFNLRATYGGDDLNLGGLWKFGAHLIILVLFSAGVVYAAYWYLSSREIKVERTEVPSTLLDRGRSKTPTPEELFPEPRLQVTPIPDLARFRADQEKVLDSYSWADQGKGTVVIPIEEAKKKFLEEQAKKGAAEKPMMPESQIVPAEVMRSSQ